MSIMECERPRFSEKEAGMFAQTFYGVNGHVRELPSERDQNFYLKDATGKEFMLKIANAGEQKNVLDFQNKAMEHITERTQSTLCPRLCFTVDRDQITAVTAADGSTHFVRMLTYLPGVPLALFKPHSPQLLRKLGTVLGKIDSALADFSHKSAQRNLYWDMQNASRIIKDYKKHIDDPSQRTILEHFLSQWETLVVPVLPSLRKSVIHNDANDYNVIVNRTDTGNDHRIGITDFGDMVYTYTLCEVAIGAAYVMLDKVDPIAAAAHLVRGYHEVFPLTEAELGLLFQFICMRLCMSVTIAAYQRKQEPANEYLKISQQPAWELLKILINMNSRFAHYVFRDACGLTPCPKTDTVVSWLRSNANSFASVVASDLKTCTNLIFDLGIGSPELSTREEIADTARFTEKLFARMIAAGAKVGIGKYNEVRGIYTSDSFKIESNEGPEWRTIHLGIDLFMEADSPVFSPLDGVIQSFGNNDEPMDYGPTIIVEHTMNDAAGEFYILYGHLSPDSLNGLYPGMLVAKGDQIGKIGNFPSNGHWPPHLHFQIITDMLGRKGEFPGVASPGQREVWLSLSPDPNLILGIPEQSLTAIEPSRNQTLDLRRQHISNALSLSYKKPLKIVRASAQYLYDENGQAYLDAVNNVCHVGHCHPKVVRAAQDQMAVLNTNTRYLHDSLVRYAQRLCATLPEPLNVCFFVNSGSEANDLALRLARAYTNGTDIVVVNGAYHGNLSILIDISPYKFDGPGGKGAPPHVHKVPMPDPYRGLYKYSDPAAGSKYAKHIQDTIELVQERGKQIAAFIVEPILGCAGQIVPPDSYLADAFRYVRNAGGVCITDEVQVGFGRVGSHYWGFETQGVVPDIVTMGKPMGNGHPIGAVVTTPEIAASFDNGMEYFNTFGGNPVSCAIGMAVLDVIKDEKLQSHALEVGNHLKAGLEALMLKYPLIGDVRGMGLFIGIELVLDRNTLTPAADQATYIIERMKDSGILISTDGPLRNVLKIKPPLVFTVANADLLVSTLDKIFAENFLQLD